MKNYILAFAFFYISFFLYPVNIQARTNDLSDEEIRQLKERVIDKLEDFQYFLQTMGDRKHNSKEVRNNAYQSNINLFIGRCEPYYITDEETGHEYLHDEVQMQLSSVNYPNVFTPKPMKTYFRNIMNTKAYANIKITQSDVIRIDNIHKISDGKYEAVAYICQKFVGYNDNGNIRYGDITNKKVRVKIDYIAIPTSRGIKEIWDIKLGDIYVVSTERL